MNRFTGRYAHRLAAFHSDQTTLEDQFIAGALQRVNASAAERLAFSKACFSQADALTQRWTNQMLNTPIQQEPPYFYRRTWGKFNKVASFMEGNTQAFTNTP